MVTNTVPLAAIYQEFLSIPTELTNALRACNIGPHYDLVRYTNATEKSEGYLGEYDYDLDTDYSWPNRPAGGVVDQDWTRLFIDDALLRYFYDAEGNASLMQFVDDEPNKIVASSVVWRTANGYSRAGVLQARDVQIGDVIRVAGTPEGGTEQIFWSTVSGFEYDQVAASLPATGTADANNKTVSVAAASATKVAGFAGVTATGYTATFAPLAYGEVAETYVITCTTAMTGTVLSTAKFSVTSSSGKDDVAELTFTDWGDVVSFGSFGATASLAQGAGAAIAVGDTYRIAYTSNYTVPTMTVSGTYTGTADLTYVLTFISISGTSAIFNVATTDGRDMSGPHTSAVAAAVSIGSYGAQVTFDELPCPGDKWYVAATAASEGACTTLVMAKSAPTALADAVNATSYPGDKTPVGTGIDLTVKLYIKKDMEATGTNDFDTAETEITVNSGITGTDSSWTVGGDVVALPVEGGDLYVHYRSLLQTYVSGRSSLSDPADVVDTLGPATYENPLSLATYCSLLNSSGVEVGFVAVPTDDLAGYTAALNQIEDDYRAYSLVPLTQSASVHSLFKAHALAQSTPVRHRWRICWLNSASDSTISVLTTDDDGTTQLTGVIEDDPATVSTDYRILYCANADFVTAGVVAGDLVRVDYEPNGTYETFVVDAVLGQDRLRFTTSRATPIAIAQKTEIWRTLTATQEATTYAAMSAGFNHRRVRHVWPDTVELSDGTSVAGYYMCAALAGVKSAAAPHRPLSRTGVNGFSGVSRSIVDMKETQLDIMAQAGTWIMTQDTPSGEVYTRLALTTDVSDANHWQDARTTNVDSLSFAYYNRLKEFVGTSNITQRMLEVINNEIFAVTEYYRSESNTPDLGPQIISATVTKGPGQNALLADTVDMEMDLEVPYAMDRVNLKLYIQ